MRLRRRSTGETREVREGWVFGRLASCDWPLDDASVSRRHARIVSESGAWFLEDLGSSNGSMLNGVRVPRLVLRGGDLVTLGSVAFDVLADEGDRAAAPTAAAVRAPSLPPASTGGAVNEASDHARARLHSDLRRRDRSRGFGDLAQQSLGVKLIALLLGVAVLAGVAWGVRALAGVV